MVKKLKEKEAVFEEQPHQTGVFRHIIYSCFASLPFNKY